MIALLSKVLIYVDANTQSVHRGELKTVLLKLPKPNYGFSYNYYGGLTETVVLHMLCSFLSQVVKNAKVTKMSERALGKANEFKMTSLNFVKLWCLLLRLFGLSIIQAAVCKTVPFILLCSPI